MSTTMQNSGIAMMLKAMGFDTEALKQKAAELEIMGKTLAVELHAKVSAIEGSIGNIETAQSNQLASIEARLTALENILSRVEVALGTQLSVVSRLESSAAGTTPAGDTFEAEPLPQPQF